MGYSYTGAVKGVTLKKAGYYKLEVWGAQGADSVYMKGGRGGYSFGNKQFSQNSVVYVVVGQAGSRCSANQTLCGGGYNGGGNGFGQSNSGGGLGGGGATHIATRTGLLSTLSPYTSSILIVAGGGGGAGRCGNSSASNYGSGSYGGSGGGYIGGTGGYSYVRASSGGSQSSGGTGCSNGGSGSDGSFGVGGSSVSYTETTYYWAHGGGGGGLYGGAGGCAGAGGGGGSGYIANLLSSNRGMYAYNDTSAFGAGGECFSITSSGTKTTCTDSTGAHVANAANTGNGYARITYLGTSI